MVGPPQTLHNGCGPGFISTSPARRRSSLPSKEGVVKGRGGKKWERGLKKVVGGEGGRKGGRRVRVAPTDDRLGPGARDPRRAEKIPRSSDAVVEEYSCRYPTPRTGASRSQADDDDLEKLFVCPAIFVPHHPPITSVRKVHFSNL